MRLGRKPIDEDNDIRKVLLFLPCLFFGIMVDIQIIMSTVKYKPVAFVDMPYTWCKPVMLALGFISLVMSLVSYIFCMLVFGGFMV